MDTREWFEKQGYLGKSGNIRCTVLPEIKLAWFLLRAKEKHGSRYDYSLVEDVSNSKNRVDIICPDHGVFTQVASKHCTGRGCPKCGGSQRLSTKDFILKAVQVHADKYSYNNVVYKNNNTKVHISCPVHGDFLQTPAMHLTGQGCPKCANNIKLGKQRFVQRARTIFSDKYNYDNVVYKNVDTKVRITCLEHGEFKQTPKLHLRGFGCPSCGKYPYDILYLWNLVGTDMYKIGVTTSHLGINRIKKCAKQWNVEYNILIYRNIKQPVTLETEILHKFYNNKVRLEGDGGTEVLQLSDKELREVILSCGRY
ncbi:endonuclease [Vibrio phage pVp-1]|uniref:Uncharacterized protein n=1 Tax=Vibrio phage pVp-1 TaxID=1150989 RepID=H6WXC1_9CAUD|nr:endonuclease [Vibrio phage pVp-1]AFB83887.1 hypothetical protein pVp-1_0030 [Vibrio phage pVp-1]